MKKILFVAFVLFFLQGCLYAVRYDGTYKGKVIDAETGKPLEGVVVLGVWYVTYPNPAGAWREYYDARETVTDGNGEFMIPGMGLRVLSNLEVMDVVIFKAGYEYEKGSWRSLKEYAEYIKWEGDKPIIPLKKLTMEQRRRRLGPPDPPDEAPKEKIELMLKEINKDRREQGLGPINVGR